MFENMGGHTSFLSPYVNGSTTSFLRIHSDSNGLRDNGEALFATLSQGTNAIWYTMKINVVASSGAVSVVVTERDTGEAVGSKSWTHSGFKSICDGGEALKLRLHYCWNDNFISYFDNIVVKATPAAEGAVDALWNDSTFDMTTSPDVGSMANDDWEIATDPKLVAPNGFWDFEDGKDVAAQNGITSSKLSNMTVGKISGDTVNTTSVIGTVANKTGAEFGKLTFPGTINDYETIKVSLKMRHDHAGNYLNMFRILKADGTNFLNVIRVGKIVDTATQTGVRAWGNNPLDTPTATENLAVLTKGEWVDASLVITPADGKVTVTVNGKSATSTRSEVTALSDADKQLVLQIYRHAISSGQSASIYFDDIKVETTYSDTYKDEVGYTSNSVLKTVTDADGNTRGIFVIKDNEKYLTNQPFEISFDYMMNQFPASWLNFVKMKMTDTGFSVFRLSPQGVIYTYTSSGYVGPSAESGLNMGPNVASKTLSTGTWYNFRVVLDPNSGHVMGYIDNELVCDYNINDVYIDAGGACLDVTKDAKQMYIELASQYSASAIKINDSCFDNLRIRTLNYNEYSKTFITNSDFNSATAGELTAGGFDKATGLYTKSLNGSFTVAGNDTNKYISATVSAGQGIDVVGSSLIDTDILAFEGNFTFSSFGETGSLDIFNFRRWGGDGWNNPYRLVSVDSEKQLTIGGEATGFTVEENTVYRIKLVYSAMAGTGELYVNDEFVMAAPIVLQSDLPVGFYYDGLGNEINIGNKKFLVSESTEIKTLSGVMLQSAMMPDPPIGCDNGIMIGMLSPEGEGAWGVILDDLSIYRDESAHIYSDTVSESFEFTDGNSRLWGNSFVAQFVYGGSVADGSLVEWNLGGSALALAKVAGGKLYATDGTTELATLAASDTVALAVTSNYWEDPVAANNYPINVVVYVNGEVVGNYTAINSTATESGALTFADGVTDARVYFGNTPRDNRTPADASGVKFEGYNAFFTDFEDELFFLNAEANAIDYVDWAYSKRGGTIKDLDTAVITLAEHMSDEAGSYFRIRRPEISSKPTAYMEYNLGAMGGYSALYSVQMDIRYTDLLGASLNVATLFAKNLSGKLTLLSVASDGRFYFINNGIRYYLADSSGNNLTCNAPSADSFTKVALVVNEAEGNYTVWVDGQKAYYYSDGLESGEKTAAYKIPLNYAPLDSYTICDAKIRLFEGTNVTPSESIADVDNISIDVIKAGMAPKMWGYQTSEVGDSIRFVATVDTLYSNSVGFDITAVSNIDGTKTYIDSSSTVFSSIEADGDTVAADTLGGRYIAVLSITDLKVAEYSFTVKPFVEVYGEKIYGESAVYEYSFTQTTSAE